MGILQNAAGAVGNFIDWLPGGNQTGTLFGGPIDFSKSLQNYAAAGRPQVLGAETIQNYPGVTPYGDTRQIQGPTNQIQTAANQGPGVASPISQPQPTYQAPQTLQQQPTQPTQDPMADYFKSLDDQIGQLGTYQSQQEGYVNDQYNSMVNQANTGKTTNLNQLAQSEKEATGEKTSTLRDIQQDLINSMRAGQVYLGGMGAGSSSAVGRMSGALAKAANKRTTDVSNQYGKIMNDINMQKSNIQSVYDDQLNQLSQWKAQQLQSISSWIQQQQQSLGGMKTKAAYDQGMQALASLDAQVSNWQSMLQQWALQKSNSVQEAVNNLNTLGQYQVPNMTYNQMSFNPYQQTTGTQRLYGGSSTDEKKYY